METNINILPINQWDIYKSKPLLIAGPCSAETEKQIMETAGKLSELNIVDTFRAGIWKPRTRPDSFEGVGSAGLKWLKQVKQEYGLAVGTEVATQKHVYEALKYGIDVLWIGARTSANPFAVQEIADAIQGVDVMVFIKNPINPDMELWIGAIERINNAGITKIGAIHRGFTSYEKTLYRNQPKWQLPVDLHRRIPDLPLICDPSHISGDSAYIYEISQKAMDLNYDGLMIESHIDPANAWSDARQQLKPSELQQLFGKLVISNTSPENSQIIDMLCELRNQIDLFDDQIIDIIEQRMKIAEVIGEYKKDNKVTVLQTKRWEQIIKKAVEKGRKKGLSAEVIDKVFKAIHQESINHQLKIMNQKNKRNLKQI